MNYEEINEELYSQLSDIIIDNGYELDISDLDFISFGMPVTSVGIDENGKLYFYSNETIDEIPVEVQLESDDFIDIATQIIENYE
jgi:hypothetical protein